MKKLDLMRSKKFAIYVEKNFVQMKMTKKKLKINTKSEISVILQENLEELHIIFAI